MTRLFLAVAVLAAQTTAPCADRSPIPASAREGIEWCDLWISHANETNLPRVLLLGDSIARDYYPAVEKRLAGRAFVARLSTSAFISDPVLAGEVEMALGSMKFEVIHFNNGMHGWQHGEEEYAAAFPALVQTLRRCAPSARLIWANTTALKISPTRPGPAEATDARIQARNVIAGKVVQAEGILVDDLYSLTAGHPELHADNVHFNKQGIALQASQVSAAIQKVLNY